MRRDITRNADLLCSAGVLEQLAKAGVLKEAARNFRLHIWKDEFETFVVAALTKFKIAEEDANWISALIARITRGMDEGRYLLLPNLEHGPLGPGVPERSMEWQCLLDLMRFTPAEGDVIWADDRYVNGFAQRDGMPLIDTDDL